MEDASPPAETSDDGSLIDVYIAYTPAARVAVGGTAGITALITQGIADTNQAYANSGVIQRVRLVGSSETPYVEANDLRTDLHRFSSAGDGFMNEVHALRDQTGADLLGLVVAGTEACGLSYLMEGNSPNFAGFAYSVTHYSCIQGDYALAHEMGHNMGVQHARSDDFFEIGAFAYSFGYKNPSHLFRDVMSFYCGWPDDPIGPCPIILHFSNPSVNYSVSGTPYPTGIAESQPNSANSALSLNNTRVTIANFRAQPIVSRISIGDASVSEGQTGSTSIAFPLSLSVASTDAVSVNFATAAGTATPGTDYTTTSGTLTIPPGSTSGTMSVTVAGDRVFESNESFTVDLAAPTNVILDDAQATGTILNDDVAGLSIDDVALAEPASGTQVATFTVTLAPTVAGPVTVQYATASGTAASPADFVAAAGTLTFPANTATRTIPVTVKADVVKETSETFTVTLSNPAGGPALAYPTGTGRIFDPGSLYTVTPCRLADTRAATGPALSPGADRVFAIAGRCGIPYTARAVSFNITVTPGSQAGDLRLYADGSDVPLASAINYGANQTRANNAVIPLSASGQIGVRLDQLTGSLHLILDVNGYVE